MIRQVPLCLLQISRSAMRRATRNVHRPWRVMAAIQAPSAWAHRMDAIRNIRAGRSRTAGSSWWPKTMAVATTAMTNRASPMVPKGMIPPLAWSRPKTKKMRALTA